MGKRAWFVINYLKRDFLQAIQNDLKNVLDFHFQKGKGGFHSVPRETFCYVDYLGSLIKKSPGGLTENAVYFIQEYMARVNPKYGQVGRLIYFMWRHGTIHEYDPKVLIHSCRRFKVGWSTNNAPYTSNRDCHLECFKRKGIRNLYLININLYQLTDDLIESVKLFINDLESNYRFRIDVNENFKELSKPNLVNKLQANNPSKKELDRQILRLIKSQKRQIINKKGAVR